MLLGVFSLADTTVAEVMTPRIDIVAVDSSATREEVTETLRNSEHARLLVFDGHPDAVAGVVYAKDILAAEPRGRDALARRSSGRRPSCPRARRSIASCATSSAARAIWRWWWTSSAGRRGSSRWRTSSSRSSARSRTSGTPTRSRPIQEVAGRSAPRGGRRGARRSWKAMLGHSFDREDVSTVGGLVLAEFGRVPRAGEAIDLQGYRLVVEQVVRRRVRRVAVRPAGRRDAAGRSGAGAARDLDRRGDRTRWSRRSARPPAPRSSP